MMAKRIGELLVERRLAKLGDISQALSAQADIGGYIGETLIKIGAVSEDDLVAVLSEQMNIDVLEEEEFPEDSSQIDETIAELGLAPRWLRAQAAIVWTDRREPGAGKLLVAALHPLQPELREGIDRALATSSLKLNPQYRFVTRAQLEQLQSVMGFDETTEDGGDDLSMQRLKEMAQEAPVIDFVNRLFETSLKRNASDIHIEPYEHVFEVRLRIDGILTTLSTHSRGKFNPISSRIKLLSGMDIAEQRLPQDGRQSVRLGGENLDLRVSSLPGTWGESLVLRLLRKEQSLPDLEGLGLCGQPARALAAARQFQNGVILITGPTGSGKSTTLYRMLEDLNSGLRKIITVEDPVEYNMSNITQVQIRADIGYTFARGLRAILRHDPDIVMVGEIRDGETASIAARAALTGHLVLSTLHTNSALGAIERLLDLKLEPFLIASSVRAFAAQRLVRRLCQACAKPEPNSLGEQLVHQAQQDGAIFGGALEKMALWKLPVGCSACGQTGYTSRLGLFEAVQVNTEMQEAITNESSMSLIHKVARQQGFISLMEDGLIKARQGLTSLDEVVRVVGTQTESVPT